MSGNAATWFVDRHSDEGRADKVAFREAWEDGRELTFGQLADESGQVADALIRAGVKREERAALFVLDQIEFPLVFWGALKSGVTPVPLNTLLATDVYRTILQDSGASIAFVSVELLDVVLPATEDAEQLQTIVVIGGEAPPGTISWGEFMEGAEYRSAVQCSKDDVAFWLYSSGSTGKPKGVRHLHESLKVTCDTYATQVLGIQETDTVFSAAKLFFAYGFTRGSHKMDLLMHLCVCAYQPGKRCLRRLDASGVTYGGSISSMVSVPQKCCTSFYPIDPAMSNTVHRVQQYPAMTFVLWMNTVVTLSQVGSVSFWCAVAHPPLTTGINLKNRRQPSRVAGLARVTSTS